MIHICLVLVTLGLNAIEINASSDSVSSILKDYFDNDLNRMVTTFKQRNLNSVALTKFSYQCDDNIVEIVGELSFKTKIFNAKSFKSVWIKYQKSYEHAVVESLKHGYGDESVNLHLEHHPEFLSLTKGFSLTDHTLDILLFDLRMRTLPKLIMPKVSLELPSNLVKLEATVDKMFVDSLYYVARNESVLLFSNKPEELEKVSPFSLQQVQSTGNLTIVAEDCSLSGFSIARLAGHSVNLGHSTYHLSDCKFSVEIYDTNSGAPPVMAPYIPKPSAKQLETLMSRPISEELVPKLQAALYSYVNSSYAFGNDLSDFRYNQQKLFKKTASYIGKSCNKLNKLALSENKGHIQMPDVSQVVETKSDVSKWWYNIMLKNLTLYGFGTLYAARDGGSFDTPTLGVADAVRFSSMQIRGTAHCIVNDVKHVHNFAVQLGDTTVNVVADLDKSEHKLDFVGWRNIYFSILPWEVPPEMRIWYEALVNGYALNEVPPRLIAHLSTVFTPAPGGDDSDNPGPDVNSGEKTDDSEPTPEPEPIPSDGQSGEEYYDSSTPQSVSQHTNEEGGSNPNPDNNNENNTSGQNIGSKSGEQDNTPNNGGDNPKGSLDLDPNFLGDFHFSDDGKSNIIMTVNGKKEPIMSNDKKELKDSDKNNSAPENPDAADDNSAGSQISAEPTPDAGNNSPIDKLNLSDDAEKNADSNNSAAEKAKASNENSAANSAQSGATDAVAENGSKSKEVGSSDNAAAAQSGDDNRRANSANAQSAKAKVTEAEDLNKTHSLHSSTAPHLSDNEIH